MTRILASLFLLLTVRIIPHTHAAAVYHYAPEKVSLNGTLQQRMFYGPPGYGEDPKHDAKENTFVLQLDAPIAVAADSSNEFNVAQDHVQAIQIVPFDVPRTTLQAHVHHHVALTGTLFGAQTGHHHTDVLLQLEQLTKNHD